MALVVYGVMRAGDCPAELAIESRGSRIVVRSVAQDEVCALTGDAPDGPVRVRREALLAHSEVLHRAMEHGPVLPLRFGVVMPDVRSIRDELLAPSAGDFAERLDVLEGTGEFQLKATFDSEGVLESVLAADRSLADSAALVKALPGPAGHFDRIQLGERIAERVEERADAVATAIVRALEPFAIAVAPGPRQHEWMAANTAFLVPDDRRGDFDAAVDNLAADYEGEVGFRLIGPLPPHSFADHAWEKGVAWA
jgi:hypothetical protein